MSTDASRSAGRCDVSCKVTWVEAPSEAMAHARYCSDGYKVTTSDGVTVEVPRGAVVSAARVERAIAAREDLPVDKVHVVEWEEG